MKSPFQRIQLLEVLSGQKYVLETTDILKGLKGGTTTSLDAVLGLMQIT